MRLFRAANEDREAGANDVLDHRDASAFDHLCADDGPFAGQRRDSVTVRDVDFGVLDDVSVGGLKAALPYGDASILRTSLRRLFAEDPPRMILAHLICETSRR
jgi:hypothetical protein